MTIQRSDIESVAKLAHIEILESEIEHHQAALSDILTWIDALNEIQTDSIEPMAHPLELTQPLRDDVVTSCEARQTLQSSAPATDLGFYLVPKVID